MYMYSWYAVCSKCMRVDVAAYHGHERKGEEAWYLYSFLPNLGKFSTMTVLFCGVRFFYVITELLCS